MSYSDFTLKLVEQKFGLSLAERPDLFADAPEAVSSRGLRETLADTVPLAIDINTEKARSEMIVAPVLLEVRSLLHRRISLFSGVAFDVDPAQGLNGVCDFLLSRSPKQLYIDAPVVTITEAKNEDMKGGIGQCLAAMLGARLFNEKEGRSVETVFGAVTTGTVWRFLRLENGSAALDAREYHLPERLDKILGIFVQMFPAEDDLAGIERRSPDAVAPSAKDR